MKKPVLYTESVYFVALALLAFGTALMAYGDLGISMVVAPAYILYLFLSQFLPFFSFGVAEYILQAIVLLVLTVVLRKGKLMYLLSFAAALYYGFVLDIAMTLTALLPDNGYLRVAIYVIGAIVSCSSLALLFKSYLPPEAYELFSKEIAAKYHKPIHEIVNSYNVGSLLVALILSLAFFGSIRGIGIGTVVCALGYGFVIRLFQTLYDKIFQFIDRFTWRKQFENGVKPMPPENIDFVEVDGISE